MNNSTATFIGVENTTSTGGDNDGGFGYFFTHTICPIFAVILSNMMNAAPSQAIQQALSDNCLGSLNPIPWIMMMGNCFGWTCYGFYLTDFYILAANTPGFFMSLYYNSSAIKLQYLEAQQQLLRIKIEDSSFQQEQPKQQKQTQEQEQEQQKSSSRQQQQQQRHSYQRQKNNDNSVTATRIGGVLSSTTTNHEQIMLAMILFWTTLLVVVVMVLGGLFQMTKKQQQHVIGFFANCNLISFFGAPLSTMLQVIRSHDSSSIHLKTTIMNTACAFFWCMYGGFALRDILVVFPNALGLLLSVVQFVLLAWYPSSSGREISSSNNDSASHATTTTKSNTKERQNFLLRHQESTQSYYNDQKNGAQEISPML